jgi:hypothetical protein
MRGVARLAWLLILPAIGCSRDPDALPGAVEPPTLEVSWVRPMDGEALADTVRIELETRGETPGAITVTAEGEALVTLEAGPPWRFAWLPDGAARPIRLAAGAGDAAAPPVTIDWTPNAPPLVTIRLPRGARGIDRGSPDSLRAGAVDPEEGFLPGASLAWTSDAQGRLGAGGAIPADCLADGAHRLRAVAKDRWLRTGGAEVEIEAFSYGDGSTPEGTLEDARHAWLAADPERYALRLSPAFRFLFCPADRETDPAIPAAWGREEEVLFFCELVRRPGSIERVAWSIGSIQETIIGGRRIAKAEIEGIAIRAIPAEGETLEVAGGRACVYLGRVAPGDPWTIEQWRDRGGETAHTQGGLRVAVRRLPGGFPSVPVGVDLPDSVALGEGLGEGNLLGIPVGVVREDPHPFVEGEVPERRPSDVEGDPIEDEVRPPELIHRRVDPFDAIRVEEEPGVRGLQTRDRAARGKLGPQDLAELFRVDLEAAKGLFVLGAHGIEDPPGQLAGR